MVIVLVRVKSRHQHIMLIAQPRVRHVHLFLHSYGLRKPRDDKHSVFIDGLEAVIVLQHTRQVLAVTGKHRRRQRRAFLYVYRSLRRWESPDQRAVFWWHPSDLSHVWHNDRMLRTPLVFPALLQTNIQVLTRVQEGNLWPLQVPTQHPLLHFLVFSLLLVEVFHSTSYRRVQVSLTPNILALILYIRVEIRLLKPLGRVASHNSSALWWKTLYFAHFRLNWFYLNFVDRGP